MTTPTNMDDVIDSRDVIARIEELENDREAVEEECKPGRLAEWDAENGEELTALKAFAEEGESLADWAHGETLVRDSHFETYAQELADDIGAINSEASWPNNCIDWERAARELQTDYTAIEFDGVTYWGRS